MRWTRGADRRTALSRTAKSCGPGAPRSGVKLATMPAHCADDGAKRNGSPRRAGISRKTTAQGRPVVTACTCGQRALRAIFCAGAPGACGHPVFPAPSVSEEGEKVGTTRAKRAARTWACVSPLSCPGLSRASTSLSLFAARRGWPGQARPRRSAGPLAARTPRRHPLPVVNA
jgi:hypothetical protein